MSTSLPFSFCSCVFLKAEAPDSAVIFTGANPDANLVKSAQFYLLKNWHK